MPPSPSTLQNPLTTSRVVSLLDAKVLSPAARDKLVDLCEEHAPWRAPDTARWRRFFDLHLLAIGVALWGLAAAFFFAACCIALKAPPLSRGNRRLPSDQGLKT